MDSDLIKGLFVLALVMMAAIAGLVALAWIAPLLIFAMKAGRAEKFGRFLDGLSDLPLVGGFFGAISSATEDSPYGLFCFLIFTVVASIGWQISAIWVFPEVAQAYYHTFGTGRVPTNNIEDGFFSTWSSMLQREFFRSRLPRR